MDADRFKELVGRLEAESAAHPSRYRAKVAALAALGFVLLALLLGSAGIGLLLLAGAALALVYSGGAALLLLLKFGKLLFFLAIPLWYLVRHSLRALLVRLPAPQGHEIRRSEAPELFAAIDRMRARMKGPRFHHVLIVGGVDAAVVQRPAFGLVGWPRNYLLLGLALLESLPPDEALAVVAHEYGHLAGAHGRFSAFIYRLRISWVTVEAYAGQHLKGWLGRLVAPLIAWYAPYFNAYTFVLARADEYQADAASAELVGPVQAAHALKRVNLLGPRHERFMKQTFERSDHDASPPRDLMLRWAGEVSAPLGEADAARWLGDALDREGHFADTHPTLRARLSALPPSGEAPQQPPPPAAGPSAAQVWLGPLLETLRAEFQALWAEEVAKPWSDCHARAQQERARLDELRALPQPDADQQLELLRLRQRHEPGADLRAPLAAFNAAHADHALGLFAEGVERLRQGERAGLALLERVVALDPEASKPAFEHARAFLLECREPEAAEAYAVRWRARHELEMLREQQLQTPDPEHELVAHGLDPGMVERLRTRLYDAALDHVAAVCLVRRVVPSDPGVVQIVVGVRLSWWGRLRGRQGRVLQQLAALEWPLPLFFVALDGRLAPWWKKARALPQARLR